MKINQLFALLALLGALNSCGGPAKTDRAQDTAADSTLSAGEVDAHLLSRFKTVNTFPYVADTTLMFHTETCDSLGTKEVKQLDRNWSLTDSSWAEEYIMKEFYMIDSIKASGNYTAWCDSLQPGMTKSSNAFAIERISADNGYELFVWGISASSYEACPVTTTRNVYVSIVNKDLVVKTFKLAEYISSVDPPVAMQRIVTGVINKDRTVNLDLYEENDEDMDLPELSVTRANYRLAIRDGNISLLSQKKEAPVKMKRKAPVTASE